MTDETAEARRVTSGKSEASRELRTLETAIAVLEDLERFGGARERYGYLKAVRHALGLDLHVLTRVLAGDAEATRVRKRAPAQTIHAIAERTPKPAPAIVGRGAYKRARARGEV